MADGDLPIGSRDAASLAMNAADPAKANAWLEEQATLARMQIEDMRRDEAVRSRSLRVRYAADVVKLGLEAAIGIAVLIVAAIAIATVWSASRAEGVKVEAFSVPPDLAAQGLTGEVVAARVLDRLATLQTETISNRAASSYANNWGDDIKLEIPETGVSLGEVHRYLRTLLGHETHITGEVYSTGGKLAITARTAGAVSPTFTGTREEFDSLIGKAAEAVYCKTQPYRCAVYLSAHNRGAEARVIYNSLMLTGSPLEQAWAAVGLALQNSNDGSFRSALAYLRKAIAIRPGMQLAYEDTGFTYIVLQQDEQAIAALRKAVRVGENQRDPSISEDFYRVNLVQDRSLTAGLLADYQTVLTLNRQLYAQPDRVTWEGGHQSDVDACAALHDLACYKAALAAYPPNSDPLIAIGRKSAQQVALTRFGRWDEALALSQEVTAVLNKAGDLGRFYLLRTEYPWEALAYAGSGDLETAHDLVRQTPLDCVLCLRARAQIAAMERYTSASDIWFARAVALAPSIPQTETEWGELLMRRGQIGRAIEKFASAHKKSPNFADPLLLWGEALMFKNLSHLALEKFTEAARTAPNWGRLHLKWGEALWYTGDRDGAAKHFAKAETLWLFPDERDELARMKAKHD